jgi:hypothetical protein
MEQENTVNTNEEKNSNLIDVEIIPFESVIDIKISGDFVGRIANFLTNFFPYKNEEHYKELIKNVKENTNQDDPYVYNFTTLVALQAHIEQQAREQNVVKTIKVDKTTGKPVDENSTSTQEENQPAPQAEAQSESQG